MSNIIDDFDEFICRTGYLDDCDMATRLKTLDWQQLKYFYHVASFKSIEKTMRFMDTPMDYIIAEIQDLEDHLGFPLFVRGTKGEQLTGKGKEIFVMAEKWALSAKEAFYETYQHQQKNRKIIRVASTYAFISYILGKHINAYHKENPHIFFEVITCDEPLDIILHDIDVYITPFQRKIPDVDQSFFFSMKRRLYAAPAYIEKYGTPKDVSDLKNHRIAIMHTYTLNSPFASSLGWILTLGMKEGERMTPVFQASSFDSVIDFVSDGLGITSCYDEFDFLEKRNLVQILPEVVGTAIDVDILSPKHTKNDEETTKFIEYLRKKVTRMPR